LAAWRFLPVPHNSPLAAQHIEISRFRLRASRVLRAGIPRWRDLRRAASL
jgi:hypothetical protein